jgi:HSP20 family protein
MAVNKVCTTLHFVKRPHVTGGRESSSEASWTPNTDVYLTDKGLVIKVELAGMVSADLELTVEGNQLRISGQRRDCCRGPKCKFVLMEINYGPFESVIELPAGYDLTGAKASYQNGFLRVDVPVQAPSSAHPISVPIEAAES